LDIVGFIHRKADGRAHGPGEIATFVAELVRGGVADYQASAWLMAVKLNGLSEAETVELTRAMAASGRRINWKVRGAPPTVDKHSTGGEGDKVTLVLVPMLAAAGLRVPTIAGRALGFTGGTIDKLESIPGFRTALSEPAFRRVVQMAGGAIVAQSAHVAPADGILYGLRDATATVESIPLITASIVSKKAAEGVEHIVYDVKTGSGAFMPEPAQAEKLARSLVSVSRGLGIDARALVTNMYEPLGFAAGNSVEVAEAAAILRGEAEGRSGAVLDLSLELGAELMAMSGVERNRAAAKRRLSETVASGRAFDQFEQMVKAQGGSTGWMKKPWSLLRPHRTHLVKAVRSGWLRWKAAWKFGEALRLLGAGRARRTDRILPEAGALVRAGDGDRVTKGDVLIEFHYGDSSRLRQALDTLDGAFEISSGPLKPKPLVLKRIR